MKTKYVRLRIIGMAILLTFMVTVCLVSINESKSYFFMTTLSMTPNGYSIIAPFLLSLIYLSLTFVPSLKERLFAFRKKFYIITLAIVLSLSWFPYKFTNDINSSESKHYTFSMRYEELTSMVIEFLKEIEPIVSTNLEQYKSVIKGTKTEDNKNPDIKSEIITKELLIIDADMNHWSHNGNNYQFWINAYQDYKIYGTPDLSYYGGLWYQLSDHTRDPRIEMIYPDSSEALVNKKFDFVIAVPSFIGRNNQSFENKFEFINTKLNPGGMLATAIHGKETNIYGLRNVKLMSLEEIKEFFAQRNYKVIEAREQFLYPDITKYIKSTEFKNGKIPIVNKKIKVQNYYILAQKIQHNNTLDKDK